MLICDAVIGISRRRGSQRHSNSPVEWAENWYNILGDEWMFKNGNYLPEEVQRDSWYVLRSLERCEDARKTLTYSPGHYAHGTPVQSVWEDYWTKEVGRDYEKKYPFLRYPSKTYDKYGCMRGNGMSKYYAEQEKKLREKYRNLEAEEKEGQKAGGKNPEDKEETTKPDNNINTEEALAAGEKEHEPEHSIKETEETAKQSSETDKEDNGIAAGSDNGQISESESSGSIMKVTKELLEAKVEEENIIYTLQACWDLRRSEAKQYIESSKKEMSARSARSNQN